MDEKHSYDPEQDVPKQQVAYDERVYKRAILKADFFLTVPLLFAYWANFLDRANFANAKAAGMTKDLGMSAVQYSWALTATYLPYVASELPVVLSLRKFGPNYVLPGLVIGWGIVTTFQGFVHNFSGIIAARFFIGLTEGGILPSIVLYMTIFYRRNQMQMRLAIIFAAQSLAGAFSGLLAAAIVLMDGISGKHGWQWIFFLEGILTVLIGVGLLLILPGSVGTCKWLTPEERAAIMAAQKEDGAGEGEGELTPFSMKEVFSACKSPHVWLMFTSFFANGTTLYGLAYFSPTIVSSFHYGKIKTQLYTVPPYACSGVVAITLGIAADRFSCRGLVSILSSVIAVAGYALMYCVEDKNRRYAALFLQTIGAYTCAPTLSAWQPNNVKPTHKRATAVALGFIATNAGGLLATWIFAHGAPLYRKATAINIAMSVLIIVAATANILYLSAMNKIKAKERRESGEQEPREKALDDRSKNFIYTL